MANMNFAVACNDREDIVKKGMSLLDKIQKREITQPDGTKSTQDIMKRCEALEKIFDLAEDSLENAMLKKEGVDTDALAASFSAIRAQFAAVAKAREQIRYDYDIKMAEEKDTADKKQQALTEKIDSLTAERDDAKRTAEITVQAAAEAEKDRKAAVEQAETANKLAEEKSRTTEMLTEKLTEAEEKAKGFDALKAERDELQKQLDKAELEKKNAVMEAQLSLMEQLRDADKNIAELREQISELREKLK